MYSKSEKILAKIGIFRIFDFLAAKSKTKTLLLYGIPTSYFVLLLFSEFFYSILNGGSSSCGNSCFLSSLLSPWEWADPQKDSGMPILFSLIGTVVGGAAAFSHLLEYRGDEKPSELFNNAKPVIIALGLVIFFPVLMQIYTNIAFASDGEVSPSDGGMSFVAVVFWMLFFLIFGIFIAIIAGLSILAMLILSVIYVPLVITCIAIFPFTAYRAYIFLSSQYLLKNYYDASKSKLNSAVDGHLIAQALGKLSKSYTRAQKLRQDAVAMMSEVSKDASELSNEKKELLDAANRDVERLKIEKKISERLLAMEQLKSEIAELKSKKRDD